MGGGGQEVAGDSEKVEELPEPDSAMACSEARNK